MSERHSLSPQDDWKLPRLYIAAPLHAREPVSCAPGQAHYLAHVLRKKKSDAVRLFNGTDGEWRARITDIGKKDVTLTPETCLRPQPEIKTRLQRVLLFAPIKKQRMDILIEKAVELGATQLCPVLTAHTETRTLKAERLQAQIIEAAEQCERLDLPALEALCPLAGALSDWPDFLPLFTGAARDEAAPLLKTYEQDCGVLIGPEGGFSEAEIQDLRRRPFVRPVSLGPNILRAETAALAALARLLR